MNLLTLCLVLLLISGLVSAQPDDVAAVGAQGPSDEPLPATAPVGPASSESAGDLAVSTVTPTETVVADDAAPADTAEVSGTVSTQAAACPFNTRLRSDFYLATCPKLLNIVMMKTSQALVQEPSLLAGFLRLHFHDCFVGGCDGSLLLDVSSDGSLTVEKTSGSNENMRVAVFKLVDDVKAALMGASPGCRDAVSCADIITAITWVLLQFPNLAPGPLAPRTFLPPGPLPPLPPGSLPPLFGRKDGTTSRAADATAGLPSATAAAGDLVNLFAAKCITKDDLAVLVGAHTVGRVACEYVEDRMNMRSRIPQTTARMLEAQPVCGLMAQNPVTGANLTAAQMRAALQTKPWNELQMMGIQAINPQAKVFTDIASSSATFDKTYYARLTQGQSWMPSDYTLAESPLTATSMRSAAVNWRAKFTSSWLKLSTLQGSEAGEVRRTCRCPNSVAAEVCAAAKAQAKF